MSVNRSKVKLRLCEHLRIHAPHIFSRNPSVALDASSSMANSAGVSNFNLSMAPGYSADGMYQAHVQHKGSMPVPGSNKLYDNQGHANRRCNEQYVAPVHAAQKNILWRGKLARNGKKLTDSIAVGISGQCATVLNEELSIINITHRLKWEEASKNTPLAVFYLQSAISTKTEAFTEYIEYFQTKNRIGVSPLANEYNIYICAPGNQLFDKHVPDDVKVPILIGIVVLSAPQTPSASVTSQAKAQTQHPQEQANDWLNQLSTITAMLGAKN